MHIKGPKEYPFGYTPITTMGDQEQNTRMDFGLLRLAPGQRFTEAQHLERAYLLIHGEVTLEWDGEKQKMCIRDSAKGVGNLRAAEHENRGLLGPMQNVIERLVFIKEQKRCV